jgi:hypothetical protein
VHAALFGAELEERWDAYGADVELERQVDCEVTGESTHVDAVVGFAGGYDQWVPIYEGGYGLSYQQDFDPELWSFLSSAIGVNPGLTIRLVHGKADSTIPFSLSTGFEEAIADAGYDVQLIPFEGGHMMMLDEMVVELAVSTILDAIGS